ncbi:hypothetical protein D9756_011630 [Leucocoprinus leucothites]|uniref:F-box domain-containing protein n=1 Tax=Leucocoprinus leucothites TaxID=201217 RepID=A0A8H5FNC0_9AGAR|nr:hypothetical protein D9756_011630 [Leucoagaricus leucothites]
MSSSRINQLPTEILTSIFLYTTEFIHKAFIRTRMTRLSRQLTIIRLVCTRWDSIVVKTPSFWTLLCLHPPSMNFKRSKSPPADALSLWLERSADLPLNIVHLHLDHEYLEDEPTGALNVIRQSIARWRTANIYVAGDASNILTQFSFTDARCLQTLSCDVMSEKESIDIIKHAGNLPNLRSFLLTVPSPLAARTMSSHMANVLKGLTHIDLAFFTNWDEAWQVLRQCTSAVQMVLDLQCPLTNNNVSSPPSPATLTS